MLRSVVAVLAVLGVSAVAAAQEPPPAPPSVEVNFKFEGLPPGPRTELLIPDPASGVTIRVSRLDGSTFEVADLSPWLGESDLGHGTLSPFGNPSDQPIVVEIVPESLPPGMGVQGCTWDIGDFFPSDTDEIAAITIDVHGLAEGTFGIMDETGFLPPFGKNRVSVQRTNAIALLLIAGGTSGEPMSVYIDNLTLTLSPVSEGESFATDLPEGDFGGDALADAAGGTGGPPPLPPTIADLVEHVVSLDLHEGTENALVAKLEAALSAVERGDTDAALGALDAFIHHVRAQRGKKITADEADALIAEAEEQIELLT